MSSRTVAPFIQKLYNMVDSSETRGVRWTADGSGFEIVSRDDLEENVLPQFFNHSKCSSLVRQLNMYSFHKQRSNDTGSRSGGVEVFVHPHFVRDKQESLALITRKPKGKSSTSKTRSSSSPRTSSRPARGVPVGRKRKRSGVSAVEESRGSGEVPMETSGVASELEALQARFDRMAESHQALTHLVRRLTRVVEMSNPEAVVQVLAQEGIVVPVEAIGRVQVGGAAQASPRPSPRPGNGLPPGPTPVPSAPVRRNRSFTSPKPVVRSVARGGSGIAVDVAVANKVHAMGGQPTGSTLVSPASPYVLPSPRTLDTLLNHSLDESMGSGPAAKRQKPLPFTYPSSGPVPALFLLESPRAPAGPSR